MTAVAYSLDSLAERAVARRRGIGQLHRLLALSADDEFADQKLAAICSIDPAVDLRVREQAVSPVHDSQPVGVRDAIKQYGFEIIHGSAVTTAFSTAIGGPVSAGRRQQTWRWVLATVTLSVGLSRVSGEHGDLAVAAPIAAHLGRLLLETDAPDLLTEASDVTRKHGKTLREAQREVAGFDELELGARVAERWGLPPDLARLAGDTERRSDLGLQVSRAIEAAASCGYHDPLERAPTPPPTVSREASAALAPWGGEQWPEFAVPALLLASKGA